MEYRKASGLLSPHNAKNSVHVSGYIESSGSAKLDRSPEYTEANKKVIKAHENSYMIPRTYRAPYENMQLLKSGNDQGLNLEQFSEQVYENTKEASYLNKTRYDPLTDYLYTHGLINRDNNCTYDTYYENIDSSNRNKKDSHQIVNSIELSTDSCEFLYSQLENLFLFRVSSPSHTFMTRDWVSINGLKGKELILRTTRANNPFEFINGSKYLKITWPGISDVSKSVYSGLITGIPWTEKETNQLTITISGFKTDASDKPGFIGNIPVNILNGTHQVYLEQGSKQFNENIIYIKLPREFSSGLTNPIGTPYVFNSSHNIQLNLNYIHGVSLSELNKRLGQIDRADTDSIYFFLPIQPGMYKTFGTLNSTLNKIININESDPNPNKYRYYLGQTYSNVVSVNLVSSEFPNTNYLINSESDSFYWENIDEPDKIYSIVIENGNYTPSSLTNRITQLVNKLYPSNNLHFEILSESNQVFITNNRVSKLARPINLANTVNGPNNIIRTSISITHPDHKLSIGDKIKISGAINHMNIPADALNREHVITEILNDSVYEIKLENYNPIIGGSDDTGGGNAFTVESPLMFRILWNMPNSIHRILGFPNVSTGYQEMFTNIYKPIFTKPYNYFLLSCKQFDIIGTRSTNTSNIFAKFQINNESVLLNTWVDTSDTFLTPIPNLTHLDLEFLTPDGKPYNFYYQDHSFTLKIVVVSDIPKGTNLSVNSGKIG